MMNDPTKQPGEDPHVPIPERIGDLPSTSPRPESPSTPRPEITPVSPHPEIPPKPSPDVSRPDRERADDDGMVDRRPSTPSKLPRG